MSMDNFVGKYSLSKTLRFELKPVGETAEKIEDFKNQSIKAIVEQDKQRAEDYKKIKKIIDDYHRYFIEQVLSQEMLTDDDIQKAFNVYKAFKGSKDNSEKKQYQAIQKVLRAKIAKAFANQSGTYNLFDAGLLNEKGSGKKKTKGILWYWLKGQFDKKEISQQEFAEAENLIKNFDKFSTYFTGFNKNRENMYSHEDEQTAISHRIIHDNMIKHFNNCRNFENIRENYKDLYKDLQVYEGIFARAAFKSFLNQSGINKYNEKIGHKSDDKHAEGVNQLINKYRQKYNTGKKKEERIKSRDLPIMEKLWKQILSKTASGFKIDVFNDPKEMADEINKFYNKWFVDEDILQKLKNCFKEYLIEENVDSIYIRGDEGIRKVLVSLYEGWNSIPEELKSYTSQDESADSKNKKSFYSIKEIQAIIDRDLEKKNVSAEKTDLKAKNIYDYFNSFKYKYEEIEIGKRIEQTYSEVKPILDSQTEDGNLQNNEDKKKIQRFMDSLNSAVLFIKPLYMRKKGKWLLDSVDYNIDFYEDFNDLYQKLIGITKLYDKTRNYVTKKPYRTDKFKINFENSTLLDGWDVNKETANSGVLLIKNGRYYLGIMRKDATDIFNYIPESEDSEKKQQTKKLLKQQIMADGTDDYYEKMVYKLLPDPSKMLPKVFFANSNKENYNPPKEISEIREQGAYKKEANNPNAMCQWIDFLKGSIKKHPEWSTYFSFNFSPTAKYADTSKFYKEVAEQGYNVSFDKIKTSYINEKVKNGELYLFQIYNKDFSSYSKGKPNLHTSYWKLLFSPENLNDLVIKLNGKAEIFCRPASIKKNETAVHKANQQVNNKNPLNPKKQSSFDYDIVKDKRFTKDKFFFHCPITLNFRAASIAGRFNDEVNKYLKDNPDVNIIGIDRGERHLLYYSVINKNGQIVEQGSFNSVSNSYNSNGKNVEVKTDYHKLLNEKEEQRDIARRSWSTIENIKELKSGYLSHIVHKIAILMIKYNAIVVLEDLNFGFKRGRFKVEKQVYQKFEKALIDKLNYLVFKDKKFGEKGHYLKGYQLTAPFQSFQKLGKQSGFLFYVLSNYTSKIDPITGFVNLLDTSYESVKKSQEFFGDFDKITYNAQKDHFEFSFNYSKFSSDKSGLKKEWAVCTAGKERYKYNPKTKEHEKHDITAEFKDIFDKHNFNYKNSENLVKVISNINDKAFLERLHFLLSLTLQLRHCSETEDFILSPVADKDGNFFDSRKAKDNQPKDADANGAFNIARKGLMILEQIGKGGKPEVIKNTDWFDFAQKEIASLRSQ